GYEIQIHTRAGERAHRTIVVGFKRRSEDSQRLRLSYEPGEYSGRTGLPSQVHNRWTWLLAGGVSRCVYSALDGRHFAAVCEAGYCPGDHASGAESAVPEERGA